MRKYCLFHVQAVKALSYLFVLTACIISAVLLLQSKDIFNSRLKLNVNSLHISSTFSTLSTRKRPSTNTTRRYAIFSASIHSSLRSYIFYAPITAATWQRLGYDVIVIFTGDFTDKNGASSSPQLSLTRQLLQRLNVQIIDFQCSKSYAVKMSQLVRMFGGFLPDTIIKDSDYIITTDSDIIPMRNESYEIKNPNGFIYNAFCCGTFQRRQKNYPMYPMSHICLRKKTWRDLLLESKQRGELLNSTLNPSKTSLLSSDAPFSFDMISLYTRQEFEHLYDANMTKGDSGWYMDQVYSSMLLTDYCEKYPNITVDKNQKLFQRLDPHLPPNVWTTDNFKTYGDAHLIHDEIFAFHRWHTLKELLKYLFDSKLVDDFDVYFKQFVLLLSKQ